MKRETPDHLIHCRENAGRSTIPNGTYFRPLGTSVSHGKDSNEISPHIASAEGNSVNLDVARLDMVCGDIFTGVNAYKLE